MSLPSNTPALRSWFEDGKDFAILQGPFALCGYVTFPRRPLREAGHEGIATYVPVHGGITYAGGRDGEPFTYGFDCGHFRDDEDPRTKDLDWVAAQCRLMAVAVEVAAKYEERYLLAFENSDKAKVLDEYHDELRGMGYEVDLADNFGININLLTGRL